MNPNWLPCSLNSPPHHRRRSSATALLMRLHREHVSATHLAALMPDRELEIRRLQRLARTTEWDRRKLPPGLFLRSIPGTPEVPAIHQMAD